MGEDGFVRAATSDSAVRETFDQVFAFAPFAGRVVLVVESVFNEGELVGFDLGPAGRIV